MAILNNFKRRLALFIGANIDNICTQTPSSTSTPRATDFYDILGTGRVRPAYYNANYQTGITTYFDSAYTQIIGSVYTYAGESYDAFIKNALYITEDFNIIDNEYLQPTDGDGISTVQPSRTFQNNIEMGKNGFVLKYTNSTEAPITIYGFYTYTSFEDRAFYNNTTSTWSYSRQSYISTPLIAVKFDQPVTLEVGKTITTIYDIDFSNI